MKFMKISFSFNSHMVKVTGFDCFLFFAVLLPVVDNYAFSIYYNQV